MIEAIEYLADMSNSFRVIIVELELNHSFDLTICLFVSKNIGCMSIFAMQCKLINPGDIKLLVASI